MREFQSAYPLGQLLGSDELAADFNPIANLPGFANRDLPDPGALGGRGFAIGAAAPWIPDARAIPQRLHAIVGGFSITVTIPDRPRQGNKPDEGARDAPRRLRNPAQKRNRERRERTWMQ